VIRALERDDLPAVVALYERVVRSGSSQEGLERLFHAMLFEDPWQDPELPSLVSYEDDVLAGFFTRSTRRVLLDQRRLRIACGIHFVVAPEARGRAGGMLLCARMLGGPQDATFTDGANDATERLWGALKGRRLALESLEWTRVLKPAAYWADRLAERGASSRLPFGAARRVAVPFDAAMRGVRRRGADGEPATSDEPLTPAAMLAHGEELMGWARLRPDYDLPFLEWLFAQLAAVRGFGDFTARLVRRDGAPIGWHASFVRAGSLAEAIQVVARPADLPAVFDALVAHVEAQGAVALRGRLDPPLVEAVTQERSILRSGYPVLLRTQDPDVLGAALAGEMLFARLDANAWIDTRRW